MKKILILALQFIAISLIAQTPQLINYQGVARDANGVAIKNKVIGLKFDFRQGGTTGPVIFSETQTVTTGNLGLFSTQIGKINVTQMSTINWQAGTMFLELGIDTTGGTTYVGLGTQQLISVPYAMHAQSVPSTFTNNVLTIGSGAGAMTYTLTSTGTSPNTTLTSTGGGATVTSTGTNTFNIDVPATTFSAGPNITIQGTHPNYTISATSTVAAASASLVSTGAATTTTLAPNSYSINVPVPTFTNTGQNIITGAYPNFTVNTPTIAAGSNATLVASGAAVNTTIAPNSYSINVPQTSVAVTSTANTLSVTNVGTNSVSINIPTVAVYQGTGGISVTGTYPNYTVSGSAGATPSLSLLTANTLSITNGNSVTIAPSLAITGNTLSVGPSTNVVTLPTVAVNQGSGGISVTGTYPSYTISSTASTPSLVLLTANTLSITNGNSVTIAPTLGINGNTLSVGPATNVVTLPNHTITGTGAASVSPTTGTNFTVNVPALNVAITNSAATMSVTSIGTNSVSINVPSVSISQGTNGNVVVSGTYPNYSISSTPTLSLLTPNTLSISGGNTVAIAPTVSLGGFTGGNLSVGPLSNSVNIAPVITGSGAVFVYGVFPSYTIFATPAGSVTSQTSSVTGTGLANVSSTATNVYNVDVSPPVLSSSGNSITITQGTLVTTATLAATPNTTLVPGGMVNITNPATNSFVVSVPNPTLNVTPTNSLSVTGGNSVSLTQTLSVTGGSVLTVGPSTNSVVLPTAVTQTINGSGIATAGLQSANIYTVNVPNPTLNVTPTNSLSVTGGNSVSLTQTLAVTGGSVLTVGPSTNSVTLPTAVTQSISGLGIATAGSVSANVYTVNVPNPTLTVLPSNSLSINGGNSVSLTQTLAVTGGSVLTVGPSTNSVVLPTAVTQTINGTGIATAGSVSANLYTVNVPNPTLTVLPSNSLSISGGNSVSLTQTLAVIGGSVLTVGPSTNSVTLPTAVTQTINGTGIATAGSVSANLYTVNVPNPTLTVLPSNSLSINGGNSVSLTQTMAVTGGSVLTVGPSTNSVVLPTAVTQTINGSGIATAGLQSANIYTVNVPNPTLTVLPSNSLSINGGNSVSLTQTMAVTGGSVLTVGPSTNSVVLPTAVTQTINGTGIATAGLQSANIYTVNVPNPTLTVLPSNSLSINGGNSVSLTQTLAVTGGSVLTVGPSTNSVTLPTSPQASLVATGQIGVITGAGTNSFNIAIPAPSYNFANGNLTTGTVVSNISPSLGLTGNVLSVGASTNNITLPTAPQASLVATGQIGVITGAGTNSFNIAIPAPSYNFANGNLTTGTVVSNISPSLGLTGNVLSVGASTNNITLPTAPQASLVATGQIGVITGAGTNSFNIAIPAPSYNFANGNLTTGTVVSNISPSLGLTGNVLSVGASTNNITLPTAPQASLVATGQIGVITGAGTNSFNIAIPAPSYNFANGNLTTGTVVSNISPSLGLTGNVLSVGASTNNITLPTAPQASLVATGQIGVITGAGTNSFNIAIPAPSYNFANGNLTTGTVVSNISPSLGLTGNVLSVGASTNNITLPTAPQASLVATGQIGVITGAGTNSFNIAIPAPSYNYANGNLTTGTVVSNISPSLGLTGNILSVGASTNSLALNTYTPGTGITITGGPNYTINAVAANTWSLGGNAGTVPATNYFGTSDAQPLVLRTNAVEAMRIDAAGNVGIGNNAPAAKLDVLGKTQIIDNTGTSTGYVTNVQNNTPGVSGGALTVVNTGARTVGHDAMLIQNLATKAGGTNSTKTGLTIQSTGSWGPATLNQPNVGLSVNVSGADNNYPGIFMGGAVGIGTTAPTATMHIAGNLRIVDGTQGLNKLFVSDANGLGSWQSATGLNWGLTGNAGTSTLTNFIGTTDNIALNFKVNNQKAGLIDHIGFNTFFGAQSGNANVGANNNTGFGASALAANVGGVLNTAVGHSALAANIGGGANTGIGKQALQSNTSGSNNTALGYLALGGNISGANNTALGREAGLNSIGSGNVFLGYQAGLFETGSNKLYISNSSTSVTPLIYGDFSSGRVAVGTATPSENFQVQTTGNTALSIISTSASASSLYFGYPTLHPNGLIRYDNSSNLMDLWTNNTSRMQIDGNGNVGINIAPDPLSYLYAYRSPADYGAGKSVINGYRYGGTGGATQGGTSWGFAGVDAGIKGTSYFGNNYTAGVAGINFNDFAISAGVVGAVYGGTYWGALAYNDGTVGWGLYTPNKIYSTGARIVDGTQGADKVLVSDAAGNTSWQNSSRNTGFSVYGTVNQALTSGGDQVNFGGIGYDDGGDFSSNQYVAPATGVYHFDAHVRLNGVAAAGQYIYIYITDNGSLIKDNTSQTSTNTFGMNISCDLKVTVGHAIGIYVFYASALTTQSGTVNTWFTGHRVY